MANDLPEVETEPEEEGVEEKKPRFFGPGEALPKGWSFQEGSSLKSLGAPVTKQESMRHGEVTFQGDKPNWALNEAEVLQGRHESQEREERKQAYGRGNISGALHDVKTSWPYELGAFVGDIAKTLTWDQFEDVYEKNTTGSKILEKAKKHGFENLSDKEVKHFEALSGRMFGPDKPELGKRAVRMLRAQTSQRGRDQKITTAQALRLSIEHEQAEDRARSLAESGQEIPSDHYRRANFPELRPIERGGPGEAERLGTDPTPLYQPYSLKEKAAGWFVDWLGPDADDYVKRKEARQQELQRSYLHDQSGWERDFSYEERRELLGLEQEEKKRAAYDEEMRKGIVHGARNWEGMKIDADALSRQTTGEYGRGRPLMQAVRDLHWHNYIDFGGLSANLEEMGKEAVLNIRFELLQEKWKEEREAKPLTTEAFSTDWIRNYVRRNPEESMAIDNRAKDLWQEDKRVLMSVNRGLAFIDPDPGRTAERIVERAKGARSFFDELGKALEPVPLLGEIINNPIVGPQDAVLPLLAAFTPRYALKISGTNSEITSHRVSDAVHSLFPDAWIAAALKTNMELVQGIRSRAPKAIAKEGLPTPEPRGPRQYEVPPGDNYETWKFITFEDIETGSRSRFLAEMSKAAGGEEGPGIGLLSLLLPAYEPKDPRIFSKEVVEHNVETALNYAALAADSLSDFKAIQRGLGADDEDMERYIHHLRTGTMLPLVYDELAAKLAYAMDATPGMTIAMRRAAMINGIATMVTPGSPGAVEPITPMIAALSLGFRQTARINKIWRKSDPAFLDDLSLSEIRPSNKINAVKARDEALGEGIDQEVKMEGGRLYKGQVRSAVDKAERQAEKLEEEVWLLDQEAGLFSSPAVLPGAKLYNADYTERWLYTRRNQILKESELDLLEQAPYGQLRAKEAKAITPEEAFEQAKRDLGSLRSEARERIYHSTAEGDVYKLDDQLYIKDNGKWVPVANDDEIRLVRAAQEELRFKNTPWMRHPLRERTQYGRVVVETVPEGKKYRTKVTGIRYQERTADMLPQAEMPPVKFESLEPNPKLSPGANWYERFQGNANSLVEEGKHGARAYSTRKPIVFSSERADDPLQVIRNADAARLEAAQRRLAADILRIDALQKEVGNIQIATSAEYKNLALLRKELETVEAKIEKLKKTEVDLEHTTLDDFEEWVAKRDEVAEAEAEATNAWSAIEKARRETPTGTLEERVRAEVTRDDRWKAAREVLTAREKELEKLRKTLEPHAKKTQKYLEEVTEAAREKQRLEAALEGVEKDLAQVWAARAGLPDILDPARVAGAVGRSIEDSTRSLMDKLTLELAQEEANLAKSEKFLKEQLRNQGKSQPQQQIDRLKRTQLKLIQKWRKEDEAQILNRVLQRRARQLREGRQALEPIHGFKDVVDDAIESATLSIRKDTRGGRILDPKILLQRLKRGTSNEAIAEVTETSLVLKKLVKDVERGRPNSHLDGFELRRLQELDKHLARSYRATHPKRVSMDAVEALDLARKNPDLNPVWGKAIGVLGRRIARASSMIKARTGEMAEDLVEVAKYADRVSDHMRDELEAIARHIEKLAVSEGWSETVKFQRLEELTIKYLTEATPLEGVMRTRSTFANMGSETIWEQARWQMLHDPRGKRVALLKKEAEAQAKAAAKAEAAQAKKAGEPYNLEAKTKEKFDSFYSRRLEDIEKEKGLPLRALSRAYIPERGFEGASRAQGAALYNLAYKALQETDSFPEFLKQLKKHVQVNMNLGRGVYDFKAFQHATYAVVHAAVQHRAQSMTTRAVGGFISPDAARDIGYLFGHEAHRIQNWDEMIRVLNAYGLPMGEHGIKRATGAMGAGKRETQKTSKRLIEVGRERVKPAQDVDIETGLPMPHEPGRSIFMPEALAKTIDDAMPAITKDLDRRFTEARDLTEVLSVVPDFDWARAWKTSVVTGMFIPRPKYWWNNFIGDFSQMWFHPDIGFTGAAGVSTQLATQLSFQALSNIPGAKQMGRFHKEMAKKYGGYDKTLGSVWNAFLNPHANAVWRGQEGILRTRYGTAYSFDEVRTMMQEYGIMDTMIHEELLSTFARHVPESWTHKPFHGPADVAVRTAATAAEEARYNISWLATHVQQRQRGNLFMELLRQGYRPRDAQKKVMEALYDWKHGLTRYEVMTIGKISPFYRFWRLAFGQIGRTVTDPLVRPHKAMMMALEGKTGLSRIHQQLSVIDTWPHLMDPELAYQKMEDEKIYDHAAKYYRPRWSVPRGTSFLENLDKNDPLDRIRMEHWLRTRGRLYKHSMGIMPPWTAGDVSEIVGSMFLGMSAWAVEADAYGTDWVPGRPTPDFDERFFQPIFQMLFPQYAGPLESWFRSQGFHTGGYDKGNGVRITPGEKMMFDSVGVPTWMTGGAAVGGGASGLFSAFKPGWRTRSALPALRGGVGALGGAALGAAIGNIEYEQHEDGYYVADPFAVGMFRLLPVVGNELPALLDSTWADNPYAQEFQRNPEKFGMLGPAARYGIKTFAGFKHYPYAPGQYGKGHERAVKREYDEPKERQKWTRAKTAGESED